MKPGDRLAHYEIIAPLGAGGMGEVHRARDTRLDREVALKVLPAEFAADPDRLARFRREAKLLAVLNHTNIASIYGIEEDAGRTFLAMELAVGETLAAAVDRGPLPVDEVLRTAVQIATGLEAAHEKGIVHRDLKPSNVMLGPEGEVKILDFGLARAYAGEEVVAGDPSDSPTLTAAVTGAGMVLGTAAYMSPEQARGRDVDSRTDVWAFGVIVFELLTGRRLFHEETASDTLASVLRTEPGWDALPANLPPSLRRLLRRCLQKDRTRRLHHIADARIVLAEIINDGTSAHAALDTVVGAAPRTAGVRWPWAVAVVTTLLAAGLGWRLATGPEPGPAHAVRAEITLPDSAWFPCNDNDIAVSPDGRFLACATGTPRGPELHLRDVATGQFEAVRGAGDVANPVFSPDGRWFAYNDGGSLYKKPRDGGQAVELARCDRAGGVWLSDDRIVYTPSYASGLAVVDAAGGDPTTLTTPDPATGELGHWWPDALPGEEWILYTSWKTPVENARIMAVSLASGEVKEILRGGTFARWVPTGHLVFLRGEQLLAVRFDPGRVAVIGKPVPVVEDVFASLTDGYAVLDFADDGTLYYLAASEANAPVRLVRVGRGGEAVPLELPARRYEASRLSPDGRLLAATVVEGMNKDIWICDLERGSSSRFTFEPTSDFNPTWSADGRTIYYNHEEPQFAIYARPADGSTEPRPVLRESVDTLPTSVSPDGRWLVYTQNSVETGADILIRRLDDGDETRAIVQTRFDESKGVVSPDGRWLAYMSDESGRSEVYVIRFPDGGARVQVSIEGGTDPVWPATAEELCFRREDSILAVTVGAAAGPGGAIVVGRPREEVRRPLEGLWYGAPYSPTPDGRQFVTIDTASQNRPRTLQVVVNWFDDLVRKVGE